MRNAFLASLTAAFLLSLHGAGHAQDEDISVRPKKPQKPKIEKVRFGFIGGGVNRASTAFGDFKSGCWTPVYIDVLAGSDDLKKGGRLVIEGTDCDDVKFSYTVPVPPIDKGMSYLATGYTKPSAYDTEVTITFWIDDKRIAERKENPNALDIGNFLYLSLGARVHGLVRALAPKGEPLPNTEEFQIDAGKTAGRFVGYLDAHNELPRRWFGYESADAVLLLTGDVNFLNELLNDHEGNKDASAYAALAEWVRRGGRLVVFAGKNYATLEKLDIRQPMFPVRLAGTQTEAVQDVGLFGNIQPPPGMHFTQFAPKPGQDHLLDRKDTPLQKAPWVRGRHGLGEVLVFGFDPEVPSFTRWQGQAAFWDWFQNRFTLDGLKANQQYRQGRFPGGMYMGGENTSELGSQLQQTLEDFQDVPVISFGWIALFILLYILIVGPVDYFFLKKVVKRLEFTWVTFPIVVLVISAVAYFTAYYVKGNDQRINKVDLVDVDLRGKQVYGQTWFTIFSPRIQHYTIGLEPAADTGWAPRDGTSVGLSWLGRPDSTGMGYRRPRSQSLFRRTYEFEPDITGMRGVPIPVWSTKSFTGSWASTRPVEGMFEADIQETTNGITGQVTNKLPVNLIDAKLVRLRDGQQLEVYNLETLASGASRPLTNINKTGSISVLLEQMSPVAAPMPKGGKVGVHRPASSTARTMTELLFHSRMEGGRGSNQHNSGMRHLDQSWRMKYGEAILVGRVQRQEEGAETVARDPGSPTRLWLGQLPNPGETRPALSGTLSQETYVRVFLPVRKEASKSPVPKP